MKEVTQRGQDDMGTGMWRIQIAHVWLGRKGMTPQIEGGWTKRLMIASKSSAGLDMILPISAIAGLQTSTIQC